MKCRNCRHLYKDWCAHKLDSPDPDLDRECKDYMQATHADRIRSMDYDSLLDFFVELSGDIGCPPSEKSFCDKFEKYGRNACAKCWNNYLTSPAEENTHEPL